MMNGDWVARRTLVRCSMALLAALAMLAAPAWAHKPDDPQVKAMVGKAIAYLNSAKGDPYAETLGGKCVVGLAVYKHLEDAQHPKVLEAVEACRKQAQDATSLPSDFNYSLGLAIIFLCEIDAQQYGSEIQSLLTLLHSRQRQDGSWSYPNYETGDMSQTQYAALAMWTAHTRGYPADPAMIEEYANWILRVQDPSGAFPYQGKDSGGATRVQQDRGDQGIRLSMSPAALGALYIAADILKIPFVQTQQSAEEEVFQKVPDPSAARPRTLSADRLKQAIRDGVSYFDNNFAIDIGRNLHYYLYSLERYQSFREHLEQKRTDEPAWYNAGVDYLMGTQATNGSWEGTRGATIDTAFSVLFLLRGTQKAIREVVDGSLIGGRELPADLTKINLNGGKVVDQNFRGDLGNLLDLIESGEPIDEKAMIAQLDKAQFNTSKAEDKSAFERLQQMVAGSNYQARLLAVRSLANSGDLEHVPTLIYALSDPDDRVAHEANEGLRLLSRRFSAPKLPADPTLEQKRAAQYAWRDWLKTVRPDMEVPPDVFTAGEEASEPMAAADAAKTGS